MFFDLDQVVLMGQGRMLYMGAPADGERSSSGKHLWVPRHSPLGTALCCRLPRLVAMGFDERRHLPPAAYPCRSHVGLPSPACPAAEAWFERHGVPCPAGTAIAEHMLRVASDAAQTRHLLLSLAQETPGMPGSPLHTLSPAPSAPRGSAESGSQRFGEADKLSKSPFDVSPAGSEPLGLPPVAAGHRRMASSASTEASEFPADPAKAAAHSAPHVQRRR